MNEPRLRTILQQVDELLRRIDNWLKPGCSPVIPAAVELAIQQTDIVLSNGDLPQSCLGLTTAVSRLVEEVRGFNAREHGKVRLESGGPGPGFWAAAKAVATARHDAQVPLIEQFEPVAVLLKQGVSHEQIAKHIYGRGGAGPFLQSNGTPDVALLEKEAREPGSVIQADWIPPWHAARLAVRQRQLEGQLQAYDQRQSARRYDDPASVEELLREGEYVQQIERGKGVGRERILETATRIGVTAVDGPGYQPGVRSPYETDSSSDDDDDDDDMPRPAADRAAAKALVIELCQKSKGTRGAAEIAAELRRLGHDINTNAVAGIIGGWKRKKAKKRTKAAGHNATGLAPVV